MAYAYPSEGSLDYFPCHYGTSKLVFRGPKKSLLKPYIAAIGGTETYGKFVPVPYPAVLESAGYSVVNLGWMNAGPDVFLNEPEVLDIACGADLTVVQVLAAQNLSNPFYTVHPRRNDRFLRASTRLQNLYKEVDFTEFHFTRHMLQSLHQASPHRFVEVATTLQATWVDRMGQLLRAVRGPRLLLWMGDNAPPQSSAGANPYTNSVLVNATMIEQARAHATAYLEVVASHEASTEAMEAKAFSAMERPAAQGVPGPLAHKEVAAALAAAIDQLLGPQAMHA
ncbi:DUF6473 family protein [Pseudorhodobacter ferrugineus]|uniref:DUF6473 family protein n=1 Tax=Pseudorhodobacter ferrugineus TaxID=77008 RepID=UPI0003B4DC3F|nr:DUF6473 family protein [Pseudorhodobacter ferrugineus]